jgi:hypothetical protein
MFKCTSHLKKTAAAAKRWLFQKKRHQKHPFFKKSGTKKDFFCFFIEESGVLKFTKSGLNNQHIH